MPFTALKEYVLSAAGQVQLHQAEEGIYRRLLALGRALLAQHATASGTGYTPGQPPETTAGEPLAYQGLQTVEYLSLFGPVPLTRAAYASPVGACSPSAADGDAPPPPAPAGLASA
ncbi:MAG: hypothetical protein WDA75_25715 [Candidatus Latescibacterota bacterium]